MTDTDLIERISEWLKTFSVFSIEDDEDSIHLSMNGQQIACWSAGSDQGVAMLQFDDRHREAATALSERDKRIAELEAAPSPSPAPGVEQIAETHLSNLLARIHRDGGHYEAEHGTDKACEDADRIIAELYAATPANAAQITDAIDGFAQYRRKQIAELRPWVSGDDMSRVSVSAPDKEAGSPKTGDMIARNPKNHDDQWLVAAAYFADNFEPLTAALGADRSSEPEFETAPDNGTPAEVLAYVLECVRRWVPEARIIGNARAGDIERAIAAIGAGGQAMDVETIARAVDPAAWSDELPVPTRADTIRFHERRQASCETARRVLSAIAHPVQTGWHPLTQRDGKMTCPWPADETVVEVMLQDGTVCRAWHSCNIMDAGDWDFMPVNAQDEPDDEADSLASKVVAWRIATPQPKGE